MINIEVNMSKIDNGSFPFEKFLKEVDIVKGKFLIGSSSEKFHSSTMDVSPSFKYMKMFNGYLKWVAVKASS